MCLFASFWVASSASSCRICEVERQPRGVTLKSFLWTQVPLPDCLHSTFQWLLVFALHIMSACLSGHDESNREKYVYSIFPEAEVLWVIQIKSLLRGSDCLVVSCPVCPLWNPKSFEHHWNHPLILNEHSAGFEDWNLDNLLLLNSNLLFAWMLLIWGRGGEMFKIQIFKKWNFLVLKYWQFI